MTIDSIPTASTFGGVKESLRVLAASAKRFAPSDWNTLVDGVIDLYNAVGLDDGSTPGSLREGLQTTQTVILALEHPYSDARTHTRKRPPHTRGRAASRSSASSSIARAHSAR